MSTNKIPTIITVSTRKPANLSDAVSKSQNNSAEAVHLYSEVDALAEQLCQDRRIPINQPFSTLSKVPVSGKDKSVSSPREKSLPVKQDVSCRVISTKPTISTSTELKARPSPNTRSRPLIEHRDKSRHAALPIPNQRQPNQRETWTTNQSIKKAIGNWQKKKATKDHTLDFARFEKKYRMYSEHDKVNFKFTTPFMVRVATSTDSHTMVKERNIEEVRPRQREQEKYVEERRISEAYRRKPDYLPNVRRNLPDLIPTQRVAPRLRHAYGGNERVRRARDSPFQRLGRQH
jgi:hypothetical protein